MPKVARKTDEGSHGGSIVTGSDTGRADGLPVARVGDTYNCPIHGPNPIVTGSDSHTMDGRKVARIGDKTACGATIVTGSATHTEGG